MMTDLDATAAVAILTALALGGLIKGATGAGAPVVAVPVMAAFFDVRLAVIVMVTPNLITNLWQLRQYRRAHLPNRFAWFFAVAGGAGAASGTLLLAWLPTRALSLLIAAAVLLYIGLRIARPGLRLAFATARRIVLPIGAAAGVLQGAAGISAPISVSFLNALRLERPAFIATISAFFVAMSVVQIPALFAFGLLTAERLSLSAMALVPLLVFMPVGAWLARRMSARTFDRIMLGLLTLLALRLAATALL